jgi:two-component system, cell cycle sensor histidine kinase and response regulator CckA
VPAEIPNRETILVVEDGDSIRKMVCAMLEQAGYKVMEASGGVEALRILESHQPVHLVLTDMIMPEMGGAELARRLTRLRPDLRMMFMSGYTNDPVVRKAGRTPSLFLPKPFTASDLAHKVRQALDQPWPGLPTLTSE